MREEEESSGETAQGHKARGRSAWRAFVLWVRELPVTRDDAAVYVLAVALVGAVALHFFLLRLIAMGGGR